MITNPHLQYALLKAAKVGNIKLMREFIEAGADPFAPDEENHNAIFYAAGQDLEETNVLFRELGELFYKKKGR